MKKKFKLYLLVPALTGLLILGCNAGNNKSADESSKMTDNPNSISADKQGNTGDSAKQNNMTKPVKTRNGKVSVSVTNTEKDNNMAKAGFPGGQQALDKFISDNIEYPSAALDAGIEGTVIVELAIDERGKVYTQRLESTEIGYGLEDEVMKAIKKMPMWTPGMLQGKKVKSMFSLPVHFQFSE